ncbi:translation elongation factor Ts [candidate division WWE3 bacterium RIFOXYC1_FULL_39_7]|uniref:Elongation factor Ts n=2 Tax=Katanobacteria TaxID=422282 RepID=A0A1F4X7E8_UNCKA|nr:MAG: translation elongation factor Ts [candidate division WWE3 bacterium RIFOXYC1_FULL_39_7]OGC77604.1 MAG: translation elongation factor Ts [candidate division WWE3 bacterium RIFOXYD1_FULL_39_9]
MNFNIQDIKKLREDTGAGVLEVKQALETAGGDYEKAKAELMKKVSSKAAKKSDRVTKDGLVESYIHAGGKVGSLIVLACETDFVAKTDDFKKLAHEIAMQVCTEDFNTVEEILEAEYIRDPGKKIIDLINEVIAKVGEKVEVRSFTKFDVRA